MLCGKPPPRISLMNYKFECPHCQQRISAGSEDVGSEAVCPTCSSTFIVPPAQPGVPPEAPSTRRSIFPVVVGTAVCTLLFAAAGLWGFQHFRASQSANHSQSSDSGAIKTLTQYLGAAKWEDRLPLVRNPERVKDWMRDYYRDYKGPYPFKSIAACAESDLPDGFTAYEVTFPDGEPQRYFIEKSSQGYKIDWEASVGNSRSIKSFQVERSYIPESFRAIVELDTYYDYDFRNTEQTHYSVRIYSSHGPTLHGYVPRSSKDGQALYNIVKDGRTHRVILLLRYPPRSQHSDIVEIFRFAQPGWIQKSPPPAEDFVRLAHWYGFGYEQGAALRAMDKMLGARNVARQDDLRELLTSRNVEPAQVSPSEFLSCYDGYTDGLSSNQARFPRQVNPPRNK